jgi:hypothetical protein
MGSRGSLSTIVAGVLVLMALIIGILIGATALSMVTTLGSVTANHVREVGVESAMYSGLVTQGNELISTRGPITIIGAVTPRGFTWVNKTTQYYVANTTEPELLLTSVGPVLLDPTQTDTDNGATPANSLSNYLWHWVYASIVMDGGEGNYTGVVLPLGNNYYLLHMPAWAGEPTYIIGPLTPYNTFIITDYGIGQFGCEALYSHPWLWGVYEPPSLNTCPAPPGGPTTTLDYVGYWPQLVINQVNNTALSIQITFLRGTKLITRPKYLILYALSQGGWLNPQCAGPYEVGNCVFDASPLMNYTNYNNGLLNNVVYNLVMNFNTQAPQNYYLVLTISFGNNPKLDPPPQWFAWNVTNYSTATYPTWLGNPGTPASISTPP